MEDKKPKTFEEIDAKLQDDLQKIGEEISQIEEHMQIGQQMLDEARENKLAEEVIQKYAKGLEELQKGLEMFLGIKEEIERTIVKLHETKKQADEHIK